MYSHMVSPIRDILLSVSGHSVRAPEKHSMGNLATLKLQPAGVQLKHVMVGK